MSRPTRADASGRAYLDLQNRARREGRSTQELLTLYALERFLARLAMSQYAGTFILKGGMLLAALNARRATVDADLLATDLDNQEAAVLERIVEIATLIPELDDGVRFSAQAANVRIIREAALYAGVRVTMVARVSSATVKLQLDINFGDPITPAPLEIEYPTLRPEMPPVRVLGYPLATVLAEKLSTAVDLGQANSRVRDYADLWTLTGIHDILGAELSDPLDRAVGGVLTARHQRRRPRQTHDPRTGSTATAHRLRRCLGETNQSAVDDRSGGRARDGHDRPGGGQCRGVDSSPDDPSARGLQQRQGVVH